MSTTSLPSGEFTTAQDSGYTSTYAQPVAASDSLIRQCLAQADRNNFASDNSYDSESSPSEEGNAELRRLCQSQEDLSIRSPLPEVWSFPLYNRFVVPTAGKEADKMTAPAKRITDDGSPSVKRSRASSEEGWPHDLQRERHVFRGGLQYHGPSTYRMGCVERDKDSEADSRTLELLNCNPGDNTPDIVFQSSKHLRPFRGSPPCDVPQNQQGGLKMPCHAWPTQSKDLLPKSPGSHPSVSQQSLEDDDSPDLVVRYNNRLGPPRWLSQCRRGPPRRPPSHATNTPFRMATRTVHIPNTPGSWRRKEDDEANTCQDRLPPEMTWRHQNHWKPPSRPSEVELTMSPISRTFGTGCRQEDATPPLPQRRHSSYVPASHRIAGSPDTATSAGSNCQEGSERRHSSWTPSSQGIAKLSETAASSAASWCQEVGSGDNAPDTVVGFDNSLGPLPPRIMTQRRQSPWAPRSSALVEIALTASYVATPPAKHWPYSLSNEDLAQGAGLLDTHCHLDFIFSKVGHRGTFAKFRLEHRDTFPDCYEGCIANFCNPASFKQYSVRNDLLDEDGVWGAYGCHPHMAHEYDDEVDENLIRALEHPSVVALGEIGLDYSYKNMCEHETQQKVFRRQLKLALDRKLPLVIHSRDATADTIRIMQEVVPEHYPIHRHCFTGGWGEAQEWLEAFPNLCLGLTPLVAFDRVGSEPITEAARNIPLGRLLIETDSPYFLPKWEQGRLKQSHPGMAIHVATRLAHLRKIPVERILAVTRENARRVYGI